MDALLFRSNDKAISAIGLAALEEQNKILDELRVPRETGVDPQDLTPGELYSKTYLSFLKSAILRLQKELDTLL